MDEFDRPDCAVENFEQVVALNPAERALTGDSLFRLIKLYKRAGEQERLTQLIRKYWELGKKRNDASTLSYGVQSFPSDLTTLAVFDVARLQQSRMISILGEGSLDYRLTCDDERRYNLEFSAWREANVGDPSLEGLSDEALADAFESAKKARREAREARRGRGQAQTSEDNASPVSSSMCDVLAALGMTSVSQLERLTFAGRHDDGARTLISMEAEKIDALLSSAEAEGTISRESTRRWALKDVKVDDDPLMLVRVDSDELIVARNDLATEIEQARESGRPTWSPSLKKLARTVPSDSCFFFIADEEVLRWGMERAGPIAGLLPKPQGLVAAAATYEHTGFFVRLHTPDRFKASALVWLARKIVGGSDEEDEAEDSDRPTWMEDMD
ncbi:MAG: hypothetical protein ACPHRO_13870, partial [Nannocystaceae bacterium]